MRLPYYRDQCGFLLHAVFARMIFLCFKLFIIMLLHLKALMQQGNIPSIAYHFAHYINQKSADENVALAAALLSWQHSQGHVCIDLSRYADRVLFNKQEDDDNIEAIKTPPLAAWLTALRQHPWVASQFPAPLILEKNRLYLGKYWQFETRLAQVIQTRLAIPISISNESLNAAVLASGLRRLFPPLQQEIDWQAVAAATALLNRFVVISGGPGTGKTATVIRILALLLAQNPRIKIELVAPTGKSGCPSSRVNPKG